MSTHAFMVSAHITHHRDAAVCSVRVGFEALASLLFDRRRGNHELTEDIRIEKKRHVARFMHTDMLPSLLFVLYALSLSVCVSP